MIIVTVGDSIMEINLVNPKQVCLVMNNLPGAALTSVMMLNQYYVFVSGSLPSESCTVFCTCPSSLTSP